MRTSAFRLILNLVLVLSLILPSAATAATVVPSADAGATAPPAQTGVIPDSGLYRTRITVAQPYDWTRLQKLGVLVLEREQDQSALVLVDGGQLETLARLGFQPDASDELNLLLSAQGPEKDWLRAGLQPLVEQGIALQAQKAVAEAAGGEVSAQAIDAAEAGLRAALAALAPEQQAGVAASPSVDQDGDGLTDTQEGWWCTDAADDDTDDDGKSDGAEIQALKDWLHNERAAAPGETPWPNWPPQRANCPDKDHDSIPNLAELELGLNMDRESTDKDKFDDGQELFGVTYCPGGDNNCGYGDLPRSADAGYVGATMPSWVKAPGNHPLVAAFPVPEVDVVESSLKVQTVTTITTDHVIGQGTEKSYSTAKTEGTSTSIADTVTWNNWQEQSIATTLPFVATAALDPAFVYVYGMTPQGTKWDVFKIGASVALGAVGVAGAAACIAVTAGICAAGIIAAGVVGAGGVGLAVGDMVVNRKEAHEQKQQLEQLQNDIKSLKQEQNSCMSPRNNTVATLNGSQSRDDGGRLSQGEILTCSGNTGPTSPPQSPNRERAVAGTQDRSYGSRKLTGSTSDSRAFSEQYYQLQYPLAQPTQTTTNTGGRSWGGAQTTTSTQYQEHTITNGEAFSSDESWSNATAVDSAHAADLWFSYKISNTGTEYAREIGNLAFNVYLDDDPNPIYTYFVAPDLGGDGKFHNFMPGEEHTYSARTNTHAIPLTLDMLKAIEADPACEMLRAQGEVLPYDQGGRCPGGKIRIVVEDFSYGADELFYEDAVKAGVLVAIEDGIDDGSELIDTYLIPTWGEEKVLDVLSRYFPHTTDADGFLTAIWTPEYRADTPAWCVEPKIVGAGSQRTLWCKHALSTADWWNIYTDGMGDGSEGMQDTPASPGSVALFRFNKDTDLDGYSDRSELRLGTDPDDPASFPRPELIAGVNSIRTGNNVVATLSLLNTGVYDAYGVEAVMIAANDTISITNNTVGGSGRVRAQRQVIVGSRVALQTPLPQAWLAAGHAKPSAGGYYTGTADRTYTFAVQCSNPAGCTVGEDSWALVWNDGGPNNNLPFDNTYKSPNLRDVGTFGVKLGFISGKVYNGESFTVTAATPRDTFQYTIATGHENDFIPPLVIVSYNDPQGNHRFVIPPSAMALASPDVDLMAFSGQMLPDVGVELVTTGVVVSAAAANAVGFQSHAGTPSLLKQAAPSADAFQSVSTDFAYQPDDSSSGASSGPSTAPDAANTVHLVVSNPSATTLANAHVFLEFINISGTVVSEIDTPIASLPPGPTVHPVTFDTATFNPAYNANEDYIVMAFLTDYQGNILDTAGRPLSSFQEDPTPGFDMAVSDETWDFGAAQQGTLLQRTFMLGSTGYQDLLTYLDGADGAPGISVDGLTAGDLPPGDMAAYKVTINTQYLPTGPFLKEMKVRTSDPQNPERTITIRGAITPMPDDAPGGATIRPLDWIVTIPGDRAKGDAQDFAHSLGPQPLGLRPCKLLSEDGVTQKGWGESCTDFGPGTANISPDSLEINGGSITLGGVHYYKTIEIKNGGQLFVTPYDGTASTGSLKLIADSIRVDATSAIIADGRGYRGSRSTGEGPGGGGRASGDGGSGGSYGGRGGCGVNDGRPVCDSSPGNTYGDAQSRLIEMGSAGGAGDDSNVFGGNGGGVIWLEADRIFVEGILSANGAPGTSGSDGGGGGSGGGILLAATQITLNGVLRANGGNGGVTDDGGGGGGGGRIKTFRGIGTLAGSAFVSGGIGDGNGLNNNGGNGTVYNAVVDPGFVLEQLPQVSDSTVRVYTPESFTGGHSYRVQFGREYVLAASGYQTESIQVLKQLFGQATLDILISNTGVASGDLNLTLDIGANGTVDWSHNQNTTFPATFDDQDITAALNAYLVSRTDVAWGAELNVPFKLTSNRQAQVLLTDLELRPLSYRSVLSPYLATDYRYLVTTSGPPASVELPGFDDSSFAVGDAAFGTGNCELSANAKTPWPINSQIILRKWFNLPFAAANVKIGVAIDNDVQVFVNGTDVSGGLRVHDGCGAADDFVFAVPDALLQQGQNLLVVRGSDRGGDTYLDVQITADLPNSSRHHLRLPAQEYSDLTLSLKFGQTGTPAGALAFTVDVGADGVVDWSYSDSLSFPVSLASPNLATAFNSYLAGRTGDVDVPIRIVPSPSLETALANFTVTPSARPDLNLSPSDISFNPPAPVETDEVAVSAVLHNTGSRDSGPVIASFFATPPGGREWYIGSTFVANVPAGGVATTPLQWVTTGFTGDVPVRVVIDPFNRVAETNENNNQATKTLIIKTRPDLHLTAIKPADPEPVAGETVQVSLPLRNDGQTAAGSSVLALYDGNPASGGTLICQLPDVAVPGNGESPQICDWTPSAPGPHRLFALADRDRAVNEADESNNQTWLDVYVGFAGPILIDSGGATDPAYTAAGGYGYLNGSASAFCGANPTQTQRTGAGGKVEYRFDHLLPGHFYHLDLTLVECDGIGRLEQVYVDGNLVGDPAGYDLTGGGAVYPSLRLDPALYTTGSITVAVQELNGNDAVVAEISLHDIDYRYLDSGKSADPSDPADPRYPYARPGRPERRYGCLDGVDQRPAGWGTLPYQTRRIDLGDSDVSDNPDNELRCQFDGLQAGLRYQVHLTFYQKTGSQVVQAIAFDDYDTGVTVDFTGEARKDVTVDVPPGAYAGDGSIVLKITRTNATANAFVNEVALEQRTSLPLQTVETQVIPLHVGLNWVSFYVKPPVQPAASCTGVTPTSAFTNVYGQATLAGQPAATGALVEAYTPAGVKVGCFKITNPGILPYMPVYGAEGGTPGMRPGEPIRFKINGIDAPSTPNPVLWQNDLADHELALAAPDVIPMPSLLSGIEGKYSRVLCESGTYLPPPANPIFNTCTTMEPGRGYLIYMTQAATLTLVGPRVATDTPLPLHSGWNWIGYLPTCTLNVPTALPSIDGKYSHLNGETGAYRPPPANPDFNTLTSMGPGRGYMIRMTEDAALTYPANLCGAAQTQAIAEPETSACPAIPTSQFTSFYGRIAFAAAPLPAGAGILATSPRGEVVGCGAVQEDGLYGYLRVYGADGDLPGMLPGETVTFTIGGLPAGASGPAPWQNDFEAHEQDLSLSLFTQFLPFIGR